MNKTSTPVFIISVGTAMEIVATAFRQQGIQATKKKKAKLSLFIDKMIINVENPKSHCYKAFLNTYRTQ